MERLPFKAGSFDAVTSQYGFEYGDTQQIGREIWRVLRPGGRLRLLIHHRASAILAHNGARREALEWAIGEPGLLAKARAFAAARSLFPLPIPPAFRAAPAEAKVRFPTQDVAQEIAFAILQSLDYKDPATQSQVLLSQIERKATFEITRLGLLEEAALDSAGLARVMSELSEAGLRMHEPGTLSEDLGEPFAWLLSGMRS